MFYAQIDKNNICFAVSSLNCEIIADNLIQLETYNTSFIGKRYNNGVWEEVPQPEPEPVPLSEREQAILDTAINTEYLVCLADLGL